MTANRRALSGKRREQRELVNEDRNSAIDAYFRTELKILCSEFRIDPGFEFENSSPMDYKRLAALCGGADSSRLQLAYQLTMHRLIPQ